MNEYLADELECFINWLRNCGEDAYYVFDNTEEAIEKYLNEKSRKK